MLWVILQHFKNKLTNKPPKIKNKKQTNKQLKHLNNTKALCATLCKLEFKSYDRNPYLDLCLKLSIVGEKNKIFGRFEDIGRVNFGILRETLIYLFAYIKS